MRQVRIYRARAIIRHKEIRCKVLYGNFFYHFFIFDDFLNNWSASSRAGASDEFLFCNIIAIASRLGAPIKLIYIFLQQYTEIKRHVNAIEARVDSHMNTKAMRAVKRE